MLKILFGVGAILFAFVLALTYVPGVATTLPAPNLMRDIASILAVIVSLATLFAWRPRGLPN